MSNVLNLSAALPKQQIQILKNTPLCIIKAA